MYPIEKYQFKTYKQKNKDGSVSTVVLAITKYAGKFVKGVAKCISTDPFDLEVGKKLAAARCDFKVCNKRLSRARDKQHDINLQIEALSAKYNAADKYYNDALDAAMEALKTLKEVQDSLK